jgi:hypothetical protein
MIWPDIKDKDFQKKFWQILIIFGCITTLLTLTPNLVIERFENDLPVFDYSKYVPSFLFPTLFGFIVLLWFGINTYKPYFSTYRKEYGVTSFHYLFLGVTFGGFCWMVIFILYTFTIGLTNQLVELSLTIILITTVMFPTVRWTYLSMYYRRVIDIDRRKLLDVINHDLTNITHILLVALDINEKATMTPEDLSLLIRQVKRMGELLDKTTSSIHPELYERLGQV